MVSTRVWLSLARVQGLGRVRPRLVSSLVSSTSREASRMHQEEYASMLRSSTALSSFQHWHPSSSVLGLHFQRSLTAAAAAAAAPVKQDEMNEIIEEINSKFADAREEIELAAESKETVYFNEEAETAKKAVNEVLALFNGLLARLPESERGALQRSMGLKMEQLKAEVAQLDE